MQEGGHVPDQGPEPVAEGDEVVEHLLGIDGGEELLLRLGPRLAPVDVVDVRKLRVLQRRDLLQVLQE